MQKDVFSLSADVAIVTGSSRGIGKAIVETFVSAGASVVVNARNAEDVTALVEDIRSRGGHAIGVPGDVLNDGIPEALVDAAMTRFGRLTVLVNGAGIGRHGPTLADIAEDEFRYNFELNVVSVWKMARAAVRRMESGSIVNISSSSSRQRGLANMGAYAASRAAADSLTRTMALEFAPKVRVNAVAPGPVPTDMFKMASGASTEAELDAFLKILNVPLQRFGHPEEIAYAVQFLCSKAAAWITGEVLTVSGGQ